MAKAKPVVLTQVATNGYAGPDPKPLLVVGSLPVASSALTAVPASFADLAAVKAYLDTLVGELKASPYFS
jgi:hypothetical protein